MSFEEKAAGSSDVYFGIEWNESSNAATFSIAPTIYRWDRASTDNYGSAFSETLSPDPSGSGSWSGLSYPSGSGYRTIDTFGTRTYSRGHSDSTVTYVIYTDSEFGTWNGSWQSIGSLSRTFTITVPRKASYTVSYNANGGSGAPSAQTKWYGETLTLSSTKPTRTGYTFKGWATSASGSVAYASGANYTANAAATLYAVWQANTYAISYNGNGATSGSTAAQTKTYGVNLTLRANGFSRTGYTFSKWNTKADGTGTGYNASATYTANAAATLYAQWTAITYSVKYNANGGSGSMSNSSHTYNIAKNLTSEGFTREYVVTFDYNGSGAANTNSTATYSFKNWNTAANGSGTSYANGASVKNLSTTQGATVNLYAQWTSASVTLPTPSWTGHTFAGWYTASSGGTKIGNGGASYTPTAAITLYAHWTTNTYTVSYNANGGSGAPASQTKTYGSNLTLSSTKPTRSQYNFTAWNTAANGSGTTYQPGATYSANSAATLYAQWAVAHVAPTITSVSAIRCDASGNADDEGIRCKVTVKWSVYSSDGSKGKSIAVTIGGTTDTKTDSAITDASTGTYSFVHSKTNLNIASSYAVAVVLTDSKNYTASKSAVLSPAFFTMDFLAGGHGVAIGKPATTADLLDVGMPIHVSDPITLGTNTEAEENGIRVKGGGDRNAWLLRNISAANNTGDAVLLGNGGATVIGSGEAHNNLWNQLGITAGVEQLHLASDGNVYMWSNCNTIANRSRAVLSTSDNATYPQVFAIDSGMASSIAVSNNANNGWTSTNSNGTYSSMQLRDKNGYWTGVWGSYVVGSTTAATHGANCMYIGARNKTTPTTQNPDGTDVANYINLYVRKDGTRTVSVSDAGAWRTALGVPGLATTNTFTASQVIKDGSIDRDGSAPSSDDWSDRYACYYDKDGELLADWRCVQRASNNRIESIFRCWRDVSGTAKENRITVGVNSDGSAYYWMSDAEAFRSALGLGTSGAFPITPAQGGTGLTSAPSMLTNLASTTAASPFAASPRPGITGTLGKGNGGTGKTNTDTTYYGAKSLFSGTATTGTVTLSETAANYSMLLIQYRDNDSNYSSKLIISPNGKKVVLDMVYGVSGVGNLKSRTVTISGTSITTVSGSTMDAAHNGGAGTTNHIYITQVWGWK